jgi:outer membrane protein assembly factor BamB
MHDADLTSPVSRPASRGHRLWIPITILILGGIGIAVVRLQPELERNLKNWATLAVSLLTIALLVLWFLFLSRVGWRRRLVTAAVLGLAAFGVKNMLRVDGTLNGTGLPKLVWRWTPERKLLRFDAKAPVELGKDLPAVAVPERAADVPQFFGPNRTGVVQGAKLRRDWNAAPPRQLWRQPIGAGWSAFAVVGGRAYTQEQRGEEEAVTCYELLTGRLLWSHSNAAHFFQWQSGHGPRATPTVLGDRVFTFGATGILDCLDANTGKLIWSHDVLKEHKLDNLEWGVSASPLAFEDTVIVTGGQSEGPTLMAYRRSDGEALWKSGAGKASYSSPILATLAGRRVVLCVTAAAITGSDPATGEILLNFPWTEERVPKASQPVVLDGDKVFVSAGYGVGCALLQVQAGADGKLTATQVWKSLRMKTQFNSVAAREGHLYGLDDGLLACVDVANGERKWKGGRYGSGQTLLVDDLVIVQTEPGAVALAEAKPDGFKELAKIPALSAKTWNHPTLAGRYLLLRNSEEVVCYELPAEDGKTAAR